MKITFVVHQFPPRYFTGTESYAFALARALRAAGEDVDVFTLDPAFGEATGPWREFDEDVGGVPVRRVNHWMMLHRDFERLDYRHPLMRASFERHLERRRPDLVHVFHLRHLGVDLLEACVARAVPTVVHLTDFWFLCPAVILVTRDGRLCEGPPDGGAGCIPCVSPERDDELVAAGVGAELRALHAVAGALPPRDTLYARQATYRSRPAELLRALARADAVLAPSRFLRDRFVANGAEASRIRLAPYGVDPERLAGLAAARAARRTRADASDVTFGFVGSIVAHKGVHVLLDAFLGLRGAARLRVHGRTADFADYAEPLVARASSDARIAFVGPFPFGDLGAALGAIDVLVVPSTWYENTPFVVLEAFAAGVPVVATDLGGLSEIVVDGICGDLFPRGDVDALRGKLQRLVDEPDRIARYRAALPVPRTLTDDADALRALYAELLA